MAELITKTPPATYGQVKTAVAQRTEIERHESNVGLCVAIEQTLKALVKKLLGKRRKNLLGRATYGSSLMKALTTIAEFWDASFSKTSFWFWSGSAPARSERLRNAMNGLLLT